MSSDDTGAPELYRRYRPQSFKDVVGQPDAVRVLTDLGRRGVVPHCLLFSGPSGCGKTTLARILKSKLKCSDADFREINCADFRGIDMVREIRERMSLAPMGGACRIWLIDESHKLSGDAQNAFLKLLEDTPRHVYFMLCTTDPQKLIATIRTRCTEIKLRSLKPGELTQLAVATATSEGIQLGTEVADRIGEVADGSARKALVLLNQIIGLKGEEEQLAAVAAGEASTQSIEIARALMNSRTAWSDMAKLLKATDDEPESLRRMILGYCNSVLLGGGAAAKRAFELIDIFSRPFFDTGKAGLTAACWEALKGS